MQSTLTCQHNDISRRMITLYLKYWIVDYIKPEVFTARSLTGSSIDGTYGKLNLTQMPSLPAHLAYIHTCLHTYSRHT
eukprot:1157112-Pelagomonas_calceolata.AAC.5